MPKGPSKETYDNLVEVKDSEWVKELKENTSEMFRSTWDMHHYMIFLDSSGCYEVVAQSWEALPEEEGAWDEH